MAETCRQHGTQVLCVPTDVRVPSDCQALIARAMQQFGRIDTLINNAGVSAHALLQDVDATHLAWYEDLMRVNLWGTVWCTHAALPHLKASRGRLVGVSSLAGLAGVPGRTAYCTTKFAMNGFLEALRTELMADGVSVTIAYPGVVATQIRHRGYNAAGQAAVDSHRRELGHRPRRIPDHDPGQPPGLRRRSFGSPIEDPPGVRDADGLRAFHDALPGRKVEMGLSLGVLLPAGGGFLHLPAGPWLKLGPGGDRPRRGAGGLGARGLRARGGRDGGDGALSAPLQQHLLDLSAQLGRLKGFEHHR